jgi:hypothetical protein
VAVTVAVLVSESIAVAVTSEMMVGPVTSIVTVTVIGAGHVIVDVLVVGDVAVLGDDVTTHE